MLRSLLLLVALAASLPLLAAGWSAKIAPVGGVYGMFNRSLPVRGQEFEPVIVRLTLQSSDGQPHTVLASYHASDIFDQLVPGWGKDVTFELTGDKKPVSVDIL